MRKRGSLLHRLTLVKEGLHDLAVYPRLDGDRFNRRDRSERVDGNGDVLERDLAGLDRNWRARRPPTLPPPSTGSPPHKPATPPINTIPSPSAAAERAFTSSPPCLPGFGFRLIPKHYARDCGGSLPRVAAALQRQAGSEIGPAPCLALTQASSPLKASKLSGSLALGPIGIGRNLHQRLDQPQQRLLLRPRSPL